MNEADVKEDCLVLVSLRRDVDPQGMPELRSHLHALVLGGAKEILVDVSCLDALPTAVLGALLTAHRDCRARGGHVAIRYASKAVLDQLHETGLSEVFDVEPGQSADTHSRDG